MDKVTQTNLFSISSKYNINITQSRYRLCLFYLLFIATSIVVLVYFLIVPRAETYLIVLFLLVISFIFIGVANSDKRKGNLLRSFTLSADGGVSFSDEQLSYQLLASSRFSFFGCWLIMKPVIVLDNNVTEIAHTNFTVKRYFIYRDSLKAKDFSRLTNVLSTLN